jgi:hypothetical protein
MAEDELPKIISDDEFEALLKERATRDKIDYDAWIRAELPPAPPPSDGRPESNLERHFPHIAQKIVQTWASAMCSSYLKELIMPSRDARQGFPMNVLEDLVMLYAINERVVRSGPFRSNAPTPAPKEPS